MRDSPPTSATPPADCGPPSWTQAGPSAGEGADLVALDWAALEVDALTWEFIKNRDNAEARYGLSLHGVGAVRMEIHVA